MANNIASLLYFAWVKSKVKLCSIFYSAVLYLPNGRNIAHLGKYSNLGKNKFTPSM